MNTICHVHSILITFEQLDGKLLELFWIELNVDVNTWTQNS